MTFLSVQLRLLGEGPAVEMARQALSDLSRPGLSLSIQRGVTGHGHQASIAYGNVLLDTSVEYDPADQITLQLTRRQMHTLQVLIQHVLQHSSKPVTELSNIQWLLDINANPE